MAMLFDQAISLVDFYETDNLTLDTSLGNTADDSCRDIWDKFNITALPTPPLSPDQTIPTSDYPDLDYVKPDYDWAFSNDAEVECFFNLNTSDLPVINDRIWGGSSKVVCSTPTSDWKTSVPDHTIHGHSITKTPTLELAMAAAEACNVLRPITPSTPIKCKMTPVTVTPSLVKTEPISPTAVYTPDVKVKEELDDSFQEDFFSHEEFSSPPPLVPVISPLKFSPQATSLPTKPIIKCEVKLEKQPKEEVPAEKRQILIKEENSISSSSAKRQILFTEETNVNAKRQILLKESQSIKSSSPKRREEVKRPYLIKEENKRRVLIKEENTVRMDKKKIMKRPRRKKPNTRDKGKLPQPTLKVSLKRSSNVKKEVKQECSDSPPVHSESDDDLYDDPQQCQQYIKRKLAEMSSDSASDEPSCPLQKRNKIQRTKHHRNQSNALAIQAANKLSLEQLRNLSSAHSHDDSVECTENCTKRFAHNVLERKRRNHLKQSYALLQREVPEISSSDRVAKVVILKKSADYIKKVEDQERFLREELRDLKNYQKHLIDKYRQMFVHIK